MKSRFELHDFYYLSLRTLVFLFFSFLSSSNFSFYCFSFSCFAFLSHEAFTQKKRQKKGSFIHSMDLFFGLLGSVCLLVRYPVQISHFCPYNFSLALLILRFSLSDFAFKLFLQRMELCSNDFFQIFLSTVLVKLSRSELTGFSIPWGFPAVSFLPAWTFSVL